MIVDTSAVLAVIRGERERPVFLEALLQRNPRMSSGTYLEAGSVLDRGADAVESRQFDKLVEDLDIEIVDFTHTDLRSAV